MVLEHIPPLTESFVLGYYLMNYELQGKLMYVVYEYACMSVSLQHLYVYEQALKI